MSGSLLSEKWEDLAENRTGACRGLGVLGWPLWGALWMGLPLWGPGQQVVHVG